MLWCSLVERLAEKPYITIHDIVFLYDRRWEKMRKKAELEASGGNQNSKFEPPLEDLVLCEILVNRRQM
jgi:hypothetical protein